MIFSVGARPFEVAARRSGRDMGVATRRGGGFGNARARDVAGATTRRGARERVGSRAEEPERGGEKKRGRARDEKMAASDSPPVAAPSSTVARAKRKASETPGRDALERVKTRRRAGATAAPVDAVPVRPRDPVASASLRARALAFSRHKRKNE